MYSDPIINNIMGGKSTFPPQFFPTIWADYIQPASVTSNKMAPHFIKMGGLTIPRNRSDGVEAALCGVHGGKSGKRGQYLFRSVEPTCDAFTLHPGHLKVGKPKRDPAVRDGNDDGGSDDERRALVPMRRRNNQP
jgi:hypothetical protein